MAMKISRNLLLPFSFLYGGVVRLRNVLFDTGVIKSNLISIPSIGVGNLSSGGTGKTVVVDYLINLLKKEHHIGVLSRGYKRKTFGLVHASNSSTVEEIGDEPFQLFKKHPEISMIVAEKRSLGVQSFIDSDLVPDVLLLDDVMQHRYITSKIMILTTTYNLPYFSDTLLPSGNLREPISGKKRAQIILVNKCPDSLSMCKQDVFLDRIKASRNQCVFFTKINYGLNVISEKNSMPLALLKESFLLITGIANPEPLKVFLADKGFNFSHLSFSDHHPFSQGDLKKIKTQKRRRIILTTEKDFTRLNPIWEGEDLYYLPIEMEFVNSSDQEIFDKLIKKAMIT
jgi:tetraacyldisaccharide 4'-kinase